MTNFSQYLDKIELIYYDNEFDEETNKYTDENRDEIYEDLVNDEIAFDLCREVIGEKYIEDIFEDEDTVGYVAKIKGKYAGFILFKRKDDCLYLSLVATTKNKKIKSNIPLGQILIHLMERVAIKLGIDTIIADAVVEALKFYKRNGWSVVNVNEKQKMYLIMKKIGNDETDDEVSESDDTFPDTDDETEYETDDESSEGELIIKHQPIFDEDGDIIMRD